MKQKIDLKIIVLIQFFRPGFLTTLTEDQAFFWNIYQALTYPSVWLCFIISSTIAMVFFNLT
jgi:hypothetical protein